MILLPNVNVRCGSYHARVCRQGVVFSKTFRGLTPASLRAAVEWLAPLQAQSTAMAESNTGLPGITELERWIRDRPIRAFQVSWKIGRPQRRKRLFYYGTARTRAAALQQAIAFQKKMTKGKS